MGAPLPGQSQDPIQQALKVTVQAADECKAKRLSGQLPSHAASVQCANPPMLQAFKTANYRYMCQTALDRDPLSASKRGSDHQF